MTDEAPLSTPEPAPPSALRTACSAVLAVAGITLLFLAIAVLSWLQSLQGHPL